MTVTVVGSLAYDAVKTPFGRRDRMLGGAATHFALAASLFDQVRIVGPVGGDFANRDFDVLGTRGTQIDEVEVVADGKTFFWRGEYGWDLNSRETLDTQLGVFEHFEPKLSDAARQCDVLFLANIVPALQSAVLDQVIRPRWTALDSMNLWIDIAREDLVAVIERVDCVVLNDAELRQLTGKPSIAGAARDVLGMGPTAVIAKQGEYGAVLVTDEGFFSIPAYPLESVVDPTGAGDTFAGGLSGYVASQIGTPVAHDLLATAMAYGTAVASFNVEEFGTERVVRLTSEEVHMRVCELHRMTQFMQPTAEKNLVSVSRHSGRGTPQVRQRPLEAADQAPTESAARHG
jgi:sugar/nucleoside kinase (ribokinase family)